jgi:sugar/nucleoside kinase (ribokinase family)
MSKKVIVSGVGCSLVDRLFNNISFNSDDFAGYLSQKNGDGGLVPGQLVFVEEFEKYANEDHQTILKKITNNRTHDKINIGGPSIVSIIHAAQLSFDNNSEFRFYGGRGDDAEGEFIMELLKGTSVNADNYIVTEGETPSTLVLSDPTYNNNSGERIFINSIGAAWNYSPNHLDDGFFESDIVVFGGTALVPGIHEHLTALLTKAKNSGIFTIVNTVYDFLSMKKDPQARWPLGKSDDSYRNIDLLIMDYEEALRLSGEREIDDAVRFFKEKGVGAAIITHGAENIRLFSVGRGFDALPDMEMPISDSIAKELKQMRETVGDTTGCGDNFVGGVIASLVSQLQKNDVKPDLFEAAVWGIISGGTTCFYMGGMYEEKYPGEKRKMIEPYYEKYLTQVGVVDNG